MTAGLAMTIALVLLSAVRKLNSNCLDPQTEIRQKIAVLIDYHNHGLGALRRDWSTFNV